MKRCIVLALLIAALLFPAGIHAQTPPCHGRVNAGMLALNVRQWPWGPLTGVQLWEFEGFVIHARATDSAGLPWYRISFANTESDPAIYWVAGWLVHIETPIGCDWSLLDGH